MTETQAKMRHLRDVALRHEAMARQSRRAARFAYAAWVAEALGAVRLSARFGFRAECAVDAVSRVAEEPLASTLADFPGQ